MNPSVYSTKRDASVLKCPLSTTPSSEVQVPEELMSSLECKAGLCWQQEVLQGTGRWITHQGERDLCFTLGRFWLCLTLITCSLYLLV